MSFAINWFLLQKYIFKYSDERYAHLILDNLMSEVNVNIIFYHSPLPMKIAGVVFKKILK
jgi:hypothetical protein